MLIARGRKAYERALIDPDSLGAIIRESDDDCQFEGFAYGASAAWESVTGKDASEMPLTSAAEGPPTGDEWEEDAEDLARRYPRLWRKFAAED